MTGDRFGKEALGCLLVALLYEQEIDGLAALIHGAIEIAPLPLRVDARLVHPPADPD
jgi:hypothetical protein